MRQSRDPRRAEAAREMNAAIELVLESVEELGGEAALARREVSEFVDAARKLALALGWLECI